LILTTRGGAGRDVALRGGYGVGQVAPTGGAGRFRGYLPLVRGGAGAPMIRSRSAPLPSLLYDPSKRDSHPVQSKIFTLRSSLHSGVNYTSLFPLLAHRISVGEAHWATSSWAHPFQYIGEFSYIPKYWEWLEDILSRNKKILTDAKIYGTVRASLFTYDRNVHVMQAFFKYWCPATNTLHTCIDARDA
jgi:hypothetical protein